MSVSQGWSRPLRSYLAHSVLATCALVATPLLVLWVCTSFIPFTLAPLVTALVVASLTLVVAGVASALWERRPGAREISFSELMFWSWYRLQKADRRLADSHRRIAEVDSSPEEQLLVLRELSGALESKDPYTRGHSSRVERNSFNIAVALGLSLKDIEVLRKAASLHDVGKIRIPNSVLHKPGRLDEEERALIEQHPALGAWLVASIGDEQIVRTVRHHHERWDGAGYPDKIAGKDIPLFARIIAVADTYDAVTSTRSYRTGTSRRRALEIIKTESGAQFDPLVVDAFLTTLPAKSPLFAGLALLVGPQVLWRQFMRWLQRFGAGAVAPGLGAVGAAVVLSASTFVLPGGTAPKPMAEGGGVAALRAAELAAPSAMQLEPARDRDRVLGKRITKRKPSREGGRGAAARDARRDSSRNAIGSTGSQKRTTPERRDEEPVLAAPGPAPSQPKPSGQTEQLRPKPQPPVAPAVTDALDEVEDPQADRGDDCDHGEKVSPGGTLHCDEDDD